MTYLTKDSTEKTVKQIGTREILQKSAYDDKNASEFFFRGFQRNYSKEFEYECNQPNPGK